MTNCFHYLKKAIDETGTPAEPLNPADRLILAAKLLGNFDVNLDHTFPWDTSSADTGSRIRYDGWERMAEFVGTAPCIVFSRYAEEIYRLRNGDDLRTVIGESFLSESYVCDEAATYLLCHNDHDYLVGWGAASDWVEALPSLSYVHCVVCGHCASLSPAYEEGGRLDGTRCACCGVRHGDEDATLPAALHYRTSWLANDAPWHDPSARPQDWDLQEQLRATRIPELSLADRTRKD